MPLGAQQRAGAAATDSKTASTQPTVPAPPPDSVSPALRSPQSLSWMNFPYFPDIFISSAPSALHCRSPPAVTSAEDPQVGDARRLRAPNFPHLGPTILARLFPRLAKP